MLRDDKAKNLISALAEKGGAGIILLGIIFVTIWSPVGVMIWRLFIYLGSAKELSQISLGGPVLGATIGIVFALGYVYVAYRLTFKILETVGPTLKAEAEAAVQMSKAFGGRATYVAGRPVPFVIDVHNAETRTKQVMRVLLERARSILGVQNVRSNIFTLGEDNKLRILNAFHLNMSGPMIGEDELSICIPNGFLSSGRAFKYFRPVISVKGEDGMWPYAPETMSPDLKTEVAKAHPDLRWIISMPIPYQVEPFRLSAGVLNVDCLREPGNREQLRALLTDQSTAAALIAVMNRNLGFLKGTYITVQDLTPTQEEEWKDYMLSLEDFDPATCPEPSSEFVQALSRIEGLEFLSHITPAEVASFLRDQLRS